MYNLPFRDERSGSYPNWPTPASTAPAPGSTRSISRVWLEISDDEDGPIPAQPTNYKQAGSKSEPQITPPLDLSGNTKKTRQPESPLDLSVKTRKRHADTTDEAELRAGLLHDGLISKRMCFNQMEMLHGRRYQQEDKMSHTSHGHNVHGKQMLNETMIRNRVMQNPHSDKKYAVAQRRTTPMTQTNPLTAAQQQYQSLQRQMSAQHGRAVANQAMYPPGFDSQQRSQHQTASHHHPSTHSQPQSHPILQNKSSPYETLTSPLNRSVPSSSTESVALQGFFEPTCKVTVNPGSSAQPVSAYQSRMSNKGHTDQNMMPRSSPSSFPMGRSREMPSPGEQRTQQMLLHGMGFPASSPGSRMGRMDIAGRAHQSSSEMELMQQKQSEHHRHVQQLQRVQRGDHVADKMAFVSQLSQQKGMMSEKSRMLELMKQTETATSQMHLQNKSLMSPYSQKLQATYSQATGQSNSRLEEPGLSSGRYIRASQPITLADINKQQGTPEQPQVIQNQQNMYGIPSPVESSRYPGYRHGGQMASTAENLERARQMQTHMSERERRYHIADNAVRSMHQTDRLDPLAAAAQATYTHPSVIQRPNGFIPPRIVSGSGRPGYDRSSSQHVDKMSESSMSRGTSSERYGEKRDSLTVDNPFSDGTQMMKSQGLSSHRSTYYDNKIKPRPIHQDTIRQRVGEIPHPSTVEYHREQRESSKEQMMINMAKTDMREIRRREQMTTASTTSHGVHRYDTNDPKSRAYLSQVRDRQKQSKHMSQPPLSTQTHAQQAQNRNSQRQPPPHESSHTQSQSRSNDQTSSNSTAAERSITKGTSGAGKTGQGLDLFSQIVMNELQRKTDDSSVNPFKNVSLLQEFDKSANASPVKFDSIIEASIEESSGSEEFNRTIHHTKESEFKDPLPSTGATSCKQDQSYTLPLQIAIPGNKASASPSRSSVISTAKLESSSMKTPKIMSRKHMILSAFKNDEDRKNSSSVSQDDKSAMLETPKLGSKRPERESNVSCPPSPKMPILSPQDRGRPAPLVSPAIGEPPKLEDPSASNANTVPNSNPNASSVPTKPMLSLEEQLHKLISAAVKGSVHKDKESVYETVRRELNTQPQAPKVFLSRQTSQTRNIPVANVAPIVHGKVISEPGVDDKILDQKCDTDMDEEDEKMAQVVTMSLLGKSFDNKIESVKTETENIDDLIKTESQTILKECIGECSNSSANFSNFACESNFDENSNSKRMSPGLKRLMLYRHRDIGETSKDGEASGSDAKSVVVSEVTKCQDSEKEARNVFGAFSEILAQKSEGEDDEDICWSGLHHEDVEHQIHMVPNTDYDGDDEEYKQSQKIRRSRQSNAKQQADRLIKKAKHRRNSEVGGLLRSCQIGGRRRRAVHRGSAHRGFVDFQPQVLPRRTRSRLSGKSPTRRKSKTSKSESTNPRQSRRKSSQETKTRQRRSSSLDRETKAKQTKAKAKQKCFSDNELDHTESIGQKSLDEPDQDQCSTDAFWHQNDESTDEEYFQNYEDEFKKLAKTEPTEIKLKKPAGPKKRKGFHFQQKYIFQRKRKSKSRGKFNTDVKNRLTENLDEIYSFHEEGHQELLPYTSSGADLVTHSNIPIPPEVKRLSVNKDTGETLLHRAARTGNEEVALYCLVTGTVEVNVRDNAGYTPLHECAVRGRVEIAKHLLKHGADVNCYSVDGIRPIHDAVENDQLEMVRILLSFGADPTLSTYAGKSLMKIARTDRMRKFLKAYVCDLNGHSPTADNPFWQFKRSSTLLEPEDKLGSAVFRDVPSDPEDESGDMLTMCPKPLFTTRRLTIEPGKRVEDYVLLQDILHSYRVSRSEFGSMDLPSHLVKMVSIQGLQASHKDSIYREMFTSMADKEHISAVRLVDYAQVISKMEKHTTSSKRSKI